MRKGKKKVSLQEIKGIKAANKIIMSEPWHVPGGGLIREFVFGAEDGMLGTLGVVTGIVGAAITSDIVILAGIAEIVAGAFSMAAGTYLATKSQIEFYNKEKEREKKEIDELPWVEKKEIEILYKAKGFKGRELKDIVNKITSNKKIWLNIMMEEELGLVESRFENPRKAAVLMSVSFIFGGILPLAPYFMFNTLTALVLSVILTITGLFCVGAGKTILTKGKWWKSGLEMLIAGGLAAVVAFLIGRAISGLG